MLDETHYRYRRAGWRPTPHAMNGVPGAKPPFPRGVGLLTLHDGLLPDPILVVHEAMSFDPVAESHELLAHLLEAFLADQCLTSLWCDPGLGHVFLFLEERQPRVVEVVP